MDKKESQELDKKIVDFRKKKEDEKPLICKLFKVDYEIQIGRHALIKAVEDCSVIIKKKEYLIAILDAKIRDISFELFCYNPKNSRFDQCTKEQLKELKKLRKEYFKLKRRNGLKKILALLTTKVRVVKTNDGTKKTPGPAAEAGAGNKDSMVPDEGRPGPDKPDQG